MEKQFVLILLVCSNDVLKHSIKTIRNYQPTPKCSIISHYFLLCFLKLYNILNALKQPDYNFRQPKNNLLSHKIYFSLNFYNTIFKKTTMLCSKFIFQTVVYRKECKNIPYKFCFIDKFRLVLNNANLITAIITEHNAETTSLLGISLLILFYSSSKQYTDCLKQLYKGN